MSIKSKALAATAALALTSGLAAGLTGGTASAATPSCGGTCVNVFSRDFGTHKTPGFVLDTLKQGEKVGQPQILFRTSNSDPAEDYTVSYQGRVSDFYGAGMVSAALDLHYGAGIGLTGVPVTGNGFPDDYAFEIEYSPYGVESGLCTGVAAGTTAVTLQACGVTAGTVWVVDQANSTSLV